MLLSFFLTDLEQLEEHAARRRTLAYRPGTVANRMSHFRLYLAFCAHFNIQDCPASPRTLSLFVEFLLRSYRAPKSVTNAVASVRYFHTSLGFSTAAFTNFHFKHTLRALPLSVRHTQHPAAPCTLRNLEQLCRTLAHLGLRGLVFRALCTLAFHTLLRLSSLVPDRPVFDHSRFPMATDLLRVQEGFLLRVKFAKNAQASDKAFVVPVLRADTEILCPVYALEQLLARSPARTQHSPLFLWPSAASHGTPALVAPHTWHVAGCVMP